MELPIPIPNYAWNPLGECDQNQQNKLYIEQHLCKESFLRFLQYVRVVETPIPGQTGKGIQSFELLPHLVEFINALLHCSLISVLKARQIRISSTLAAYILWYALFHEGANILLFSKGQPEAKELLGKAHRIYDLLPPFLQLKTGEDSTEAMTFPSIGSKIAAFPSTTSAGISYTASIIVCDEHAFHPYADENYMSSKPTRDAGGQYISVSTEDPTSADNLFTSLFTDAREGKNDFKWLFFPWDVVPGRDKEWYERTKRNIPDRELAGVSPDIYMAKNYPSSIEEALTVSKTTQAFDVDTLAAMVADTRNPIKIEGEGMDWNVIHIFKPYSTGSFYVAASDTSHGVGKDFSVTVILNVKTGEVVADILSSTLSPEEFAAHSLTVLAHYHNPLWYIEDNDWGRVVISCAETANYKYLGKTGNKGSEKVGFHTGGNRIEIWGSLIPAINNRQVVIYNVEGLRQFFDVIRNVKNEGRIEAKSRGHDDYPIAVGIAWLMRDKVNTGDVSTPILNYA